MIRSSGKRLINENGSLNASVECGSVSKHSTSAYYLINATSCLVQVDGLGEVGRTSTSVCASIAWSEVGALSASIDLDGRLEIEY